VRDDDEKRLLLFLSYEGSNPDARTKVHDDDRDRAAFSYNGKRGKHVLKSDESGGKRFILCAIVLAFPSSTWTIHSARIR
jgi:hypothetical protein